MYGFGSASSMIENVTEKEAATTKSRGKRQSVAWRRRPSSRATARYAKMVNGSSRNACTRSSEGESQRPSPTCVATIPTSGSCRPIANHGPGM